MNDTTAGRDYRETLFLPKTDFPMKAGLPRKEPEIIARWKDRLSVVDVWADSHCEAMVLYYIMH